MLTRHLEEVSLVIHRPLFNPGQLAGMFIVPRFELWNDSTSTIRPSVMYADPEENPKKGLKSCIKDLFSPYSAPITIKALVPVLFGAPMASRDPP